MRKKGARNAASHVGKGPGLFHKPGFGKNERLWEAVCILLIALIAFIFSLKVSNNIWHKGNIDPDGSVFYYVARVMLNGGMPYLDAFDHKGPLVYFINAAGILISSWRGIWVLELLGLFVTFYFMYRLARLQVSRGMSLSLLILSSSALFSFFSGGNYTEEYAMPFIAISLYIFADYFLNAQVTPLRLVVCGFSFAAILLLRANMCSVWLVMCLAVLAQCVGKREFKQLGRFIGYFTLGALILLVPILLWLAFRGALGAFWDNYIRFNMTYSSESTWASLTKRASAAVFFLDRALILFSLCGLIYLCYRERKFFDLAYLAYLVITLLLICISGQSYNHYAMILVPALILPLARLVALLETSLPDRVVAHLLVLYLLVTLAASPWLNICRTAADYYSTRDKTHFGKNELETVELVSAHSGPEDEIIVIGNWDIIYNLSDRYAASRYSYQYPPLNIDEDRAKEFFEDLQSTPPKVVVFAANSAWLSLKPQVQQFVAEHPYREVGKTSDGAVTVYALDN